MPPGADVCLKCSDNFIVNTKSICCKLCKSLYHTQCVQVKDAWQKIFGECKNVLWLCDPCKNTWDKKVNNIDTNYSEIILKKEIECLQREKGLLTKVLSEVKYTCELQKKIIHNYESADKATKIANQNSVVNNQLFSEIVQKNNKSTAVLLIKSKKPDSMDSDILQKFHVK